MPKHHPIPTEIRLHTRRRILEIAFGDGTHFELPCRHLRAHAPSADVRLARERGETVTVNPHVNVRAIHPVGSYAVRIEFDDGHHHGIFSWEVLYELGRALENAGSAHAEGSLESGRHSATAGSGMIRILYFASLADRLGHEMEEVPLAGVDDVAGLLARLRVRGRPWAEALEPDAVRVTVNKAFAGPHTPVAAGDEVAMVPVRAG